MIFGWRKMWVMFLGEEGGVCGGVKVREREVFYDFWVEGVADVFR